MASSNQQGVTQENSPSGTARLVRVKQYPCPIVSCSTVLKCPAQFKEHIQSVHQLERHHVCGIDQCEVTFKYKIDLKRHQEGKVHHPDDATKFFCSCGNSYTRKSNRDKHMRVKQHWEPTEETRHFAPSTETSFVRNEQQEWLEGPHATSESVSEETSRLAESQVSRGQNAPHSLIIYPDQQTGEPDGSSTFSVHDATPVELQRRVRYLEERLTYMEQENKRLKRRKSGDAYCRTETSSAPGLETSSTNPDIVAAPSVSDRPQHSDHESVLDINTYYESDMNCIDQRNGMYGLGIGASQLRDSAYDQLWHDLLETRTFDPEDPSRETSEANIQQAIRDVDHNWIT